jgi:murein DD-endopeptidase MepM/ murein hydrolase activator NlpD
MVQQGQTIGYVGSTGLATGPHVCYRFWKNGKQIDHRTEKFPTSIPMVDSLLPSYLEYINQLRKKLTLCRLHLIRWKKLRNRSLTSRFK